MMKAAVTCGVFVWASAGGQQPLLVRAQPRKSFINRTAADWQTLR
jgi:hypothetical protein